MDAQFAEFLSYYQYAENALIIERNYFRDRKDDPFLTTGERLESMTAMTQLDAKLSELRFKREAVVAAHDGGTFPSPSAPTLTEARDAAQVLSKALQNAANVVAVVLAASDFMKVIGQLSAVGPAARSPVLAPTGG